jgi:cell division protein FtsZ
MMQAERGLQELLDAVDTVIVIPNEKLLAVAKDAGFFESFRIADDVLRQGVQGISDIITIPGVINRDFADVKTTMAGMGYAVMGTALRSGPDRAKDAAIAAMASPLLEAGAIDGARGILINITGSSSLKLSEVNDASMIIQDAAHEDANIIFGAVQDESMGDEVKITVIATGFKQSEQTDRRERMLAGTTLPTVYSTADVPIGRFTPTRTGPARFASEEPAPAREIPVARTAPSTAREVPVNPRDESEPTRLSLYEERDAASSAVPPGIHSTEAAAPSDPSTSQSENTIGYQPASPIHREPQAAATTATYQIDRPAPRSFADTMDEAFATPRPPFSAAPPSPLASVEQRSEVSTRDGLAPVRASVFDDEFFRSTPVRSAREEPPIAAATGLHDFVPTLHVQRTDPRTTDSRVYSDFDSSPEKRSPYFGASPEQVGQAQPDELDIPAFLRKGN